MTQSMIRYLRPAEHVVTCDLGHAVVLVSYSTGQTLTLIGPSVAWWNTLARSGDVTALSPSQQEVTDRLLPKLLASKTVVPSAAPHGWPPARPAVAWQPSRGTHEVVVALPPARMTSTADVLLAATALCLVLLVQRAGPRRRRMARLRKLLTFAERRARTPAGAEDVARLVSAVRRVSLLSPPRVACLEESAAALLAIAARGHRARWCHGLAADPIRLHAWVETLDGSAPAELVPTDCYTKLHTIPNHEE